MHLLYCNAEGIVIAAHDDEQPAVGLHAYPSVVRIIPYDQPLSTLERIGTAPPPAERGEYQPDRRPYKQPNPTPHILKMYASQCRYNGIFQGLTFNAASGPIPIWTDRESYSLIAHLAAYANTIPNSNILHFTQGSTHYRITAAEAKSLFGACNQHVQQARTAEATCIDDQNAAVPTMKTYADIDALFAGMIVEKSSKATIRPRMGV